MHIIDQQLKLLLLFYNNWLGIISISKEISGQQTLSDVFENVLKICAKYIIRLKRYKL